MLTIPYVATQEKRKCGDLISQLLLESKATTSCTIAFMMLLGTVETESPDQIQPWFSQRLSDGQPRVAIFLAK